MNFAFACLFLGLTVIMAQPAAVEETRSTLEEWVLTEKTISAEREDWQAEKATMADLIRLLKDEKALLKQSLEEAEAVTTQAEARRGELLEKRVALQQATAALEGHLAQFETALRDLQPKLPGPLLKKVQPLLQRLPKPNQPSSLSVGQRAQNVVGILGEVDKFNREVTLDTQIQQLEDGRSVEVRVLWLGLGAAYYADVAGRHTGTLQYTGEGWTPEARPDLSEAINRAIAQYERSVPAAFVNLPIDIK